jgi:ATP-dependent Clp endopeptidase proteolytic subunit ClpP
MPRGDILHRAGRLNGCNPACCRREGASSCIAAFSHHDSPALGGAQGKASDIEITAREILRLKDVLNGILAEASGKSIEEVKQDTDRDHFMSALEAKDWGIVDEVL